MSLVFFRVAWVRRWLLFQVAHVADFSKVAPVADFSPGYARRWFLFPSRTTPSLTSISGCAHRWIFLRSRPLLILPQVTHVAGFFPGRTIPSLTSLSDCACRLLLFHRSRQSLTGRASSCRCYFFPSFAYRWFFCRLARVLRWLPFQVAHIADFSQVAPVADFSPGYARRWFLFPSRTTPSLTSISGCAHRWIFLRSRPSLILPQVTHVAGFFPGRMSTSMTSFSGCAHRWLFPGRARCWFFPRLRTSLISFS